MKTLQITQGLYRFIGYVVYPLLCTGYDPIRLINAQNKGKMAFAKNQPKTIRRKTKKWIRDKRDDEKGTAKCHGLLLVRGQIGRIKQFAPRINGFAGGHSNHLTSVQKKPKKMLLSTTFRKTIYFSDKNRTVFELFSAFIEE